MLTAIVQPILKIMHFLHTSVVFILTTAYHVGRIIFLFLTQVCHVVRDTFTVLAILGEELYHFICEVNTSVNDVSNYVRTSANCGINCIMEAGGLFLLHIAKFFSNTRLHSKLLATQLGCFVCEIFKLIKNALLLIADCAWWLITLLPRWLLYAIIAVGDVIIAIITAVRQALVYAVQVIVEDIFRMTIAFVLLFLLWHNRRRICLATIRWCLKIKRLIKLAFIRLIALGRRLFRRPPPSAPLTTPARVLRRSPLPQPRSLNGFREKKPLDAAHRCVICRDSQKCVLLLPCKHLCLCEDCADYLFFTMQSQTCPLCRTNISHSMSVYI